MNLPEDLMRNSHFVRYYHTWQKNPLSVVFIPLAQICREKGLFFEARTLCEEGLTHHPRSVSGRLMLSRILFDLEHFEEAERLVRDILMELPGQKEAQSLKHQIARCRGLPPEDQRQGQPPTTSLWENVTMAKVYADQGERKISLQILERVLAKKPNDERALRLQRELNS